MLRPNTVPQLCVFLTLKVLLLPTSFSTWLHHVKNPAKDSSVALMPVAAVLAMASFLITACSLYNVYHRVTFKRVPGTIQAPPLTGSQLSVWFLAAVGCVLLYAVVVGQIEALTVPLFEPYEILEIARGSNSTVVKKAYKKLSLMVRLCVEWPLLLRYRATSHIISLTPPMYHDALSRRSTIPTKAATPTPSSSSPLPTRRFRTLSPCLITRNLAIPTASR